MELARQGEAVAPDGESWTKNGLPNAETGEWAISDWVTAFNGLVEKILGGPRRGNTGTPLLGHSFHREV